MFQVPATAATYVRFETEAEIAQYLDGQTWRKKRHLILGGGSNLLFKREHEVMVVGMM